MNVDQIIERDARQDEIADEVLDALNAFGFVSVTSSYFVHPSKGIIFTIDARHKDGSHRIWIGVGQDEDEAQLDAIGALHQWILMQPIP